MKLAPAVEHLSLFWTVQTHQTLHQHRFARSGTPDDQVHLALLELGVDAVQDLLFAEIFGNVVDLDHLMFKG